MESKIISIEEANRMLPLLRKIVKDVMDKWELIIRRRTELECLEKGIARGERGSNTEGKINELKGELNFLIEKINQYIKEVECLGCFVEEFKRGIINFPSLYHGRKIFLCWSPDEEVVAHLFFDPPPVCATWPINAFLLNQRLRIQQGVFMISGDVTRPFMENLKALMVGADSDGKLLKIVIPARVSQKAVPRLFSMGLSRTSLFPGLDGYARALGIWHPAYDRLPGIGKSF